MAERIATTPVASGFTVYQNPDPPRSAGSGWGRYSHGNPEAVGDAFASAMSYGMPGQQPTPAAGRESVSSDSDIRRLEDRIEASKRESDLRLELALTVLGGKLDTVAAGLSAAQKDAAQDRRDASGARNEARDSARTWGQWIIASVVAVGVALAATAIGLTQVWIGGAQTGLSIRQLPPAAAPSTTAKP